MLHDRDAVIVAGVRTPFAREATVFAGVSTAELGRIAVREAVERSEIDPEAIDEVILGNVAAPTAAFDLGRTIALLAKLPERVPATTLDRSCASGLEAVALAASRIRAGEAQLVVAAGAESSSAASRDRGSEPGGSSGRLHGARERIRGRFSARREGPGGFGTLAAALALGLPDPLTGRPAGHLADRLAREFGVTREEQDAFALRSHRLATAAWSEGRFDREVAPAPIPPSFETVVLRDSGVEEKLEASRLSTLGPVFDRRHGSVTRGNAASKGDGAVAVVLASAARARALGLPVLGRVRAWASSGFDPSRAGIGGVFAMSLALKRAGGAPLERLDLVEIHEGFAAQVLAAQRALASRGFCEEHLGSGPVGAVDPARLNVNGGAIALGHPAGASGARLLLTLALEMERRGAALGLAAVSAGGGQGAAVVLERS